MQRFFLNSECFRENKILIADARVAHQMLRVMRMQAGDNFIALDNSGNEFFCVLKDIGEKKVEAAVLEKKSNIDPAPAVTLFQALPKKLGLFEFILQKCTEIGISAFVPLITARTERRELSKFPRLQTILREAAEQCGRGKIPILHPVKNFSSLSGAMPSNSIILHTNQNAELLSSIIPSLKSQKEINIFIGPEGGFTDEEIGAARKSGAKIVFLGARTLRTETAAIAASALILC